MSFSYHPELVYQVALTMAPAIGPVNARKLIDKAGSASGVFFMDRASLEKIPGIGPVLSQSIRSPGLLEKARKELEFLERHKIRALYFRDSDYPARLKECQDAPILLFSRGNEQLHKKRVLSVVGTRKASLYGKELCRNIVLELAGRFSDLVIVSGLAFGIDVIAHRAALEAGIPTMAVLGHGLRTLYPNAHRETAKKICRQGALLTDFHSDMGPERNNFLRRNRIIAGIADATLVVESGESGGSLTTADMAFSYERDVLAVPGRATDERSRGCNRLIKLNMAAMVESAEDVIKHLRWPGEPAVYRMQGSMQHCFTIQEQKLLEFLSPDGGLGPGELSRLSGIPIQEVLSVLTQMELKRWIRMEPGNLYQSIIKLP
jgi:DNA processing protein